VFWSQHLGCWGQNTSRIEEQRSSRHIRATATAESMRSMIPMRHRVTLLRRCKYSMLRVFSAWCGGEAITAWHTPRRAHMHASTHTHTHTYAQTHTHTATNTSSVPAAPHTLSSTTHPHRQPKLQSRCGSWNPTAWKMRLSPALSTPSRNIGTDHAVGERAGLPRVPHLPAKHRVVAATSPHLSVKHRVVVGLKKQIMKHMRV
jgi:hypothetical protein